MTTTIIKDLIGVTLIDIDVTGDELITFKLNDGRSFELYHFQDCCESVTVDDINGDWNDLIGTPILVAEERVNESYGGEGHQTWTFYTFRTIKGYVDVKWYGQSNGYYSESVDYGFINA